jgi:hypothetical protein
VRKESVEFLIAEESLIVPVGEVASVGGFLKSHLSYKTIISRIAHSLTITSKS